MISNCYKVAAFDFDGVLFDSKRECFEIALATCKGNPHWIPSDSWTAKESSVGLRELFFKYRYLVGPPWQYALLLKFIEDERFDLLNTHSFAKAAQEQSSHYETFTSAFFATRHHFMQQQDVWPRLLEPFPDAGQFFVEEFNLGRVKILSTRDQISIRSAIKYHFAVELGDDSFLERAGPHSKAEILINYCSKVGIEPVDVIFLEDHILHALPAFDMGFQVLLCEWGYLTADELNEAHNRGLPTIPLNAIHKLSESCKQV